MQMIFHPENPQGNTIIPNDEEQRHLRALRMEEGTQILVSNGSGTIFLCEAIILKKETHLNVISSTFHEQRQAFLEIAIAPTKNNDRLEWFVEKAVELGIEKIYLPNIDLESVPQIHDLCAHDPEMFIPMMGLHPCDVGDDFEAQLQVMENWLSKRPFAAVGEIGTDLYWDKTNLDRQLAALEIQEVMLGQRMRARPTELSQ